MGNTLTARRVTIVVTGPGGGYLEEHRLPMWTSFEDAATAAENLLSERKHDPLCASISLYLNGQFKGKWVRMNGTCYWIDNSVYEEVS